MDRQSGRFNSNPYAMGLDAGYFTPTVCKGLENRFIAGGMGYRRPTHKGGYFYKRGYVYDAQSDTYEYPHHQDAKERADARRPSQPKINKPRCKKTGGFIGSLKAILRMAPDERSEIRSCTVIQAGLRPAFD